MSKDAFSQVCDFIEENIGIVRRFPENNRLTFQFKYMNTIYHALMKVGSERLALEIMTPIAIPEGCIPDILRAICLANYGLNVGHFSLDCEDGFMEFQASTIFFDQLDDRVIDHLMKSSIMTLDHFFPAMLSIVFGNEVPEDAIRLARQELE